MIKKPNQQRKRRTRLKLKKSSDRPRLSVSRSNKYIYAQIIGFNGEVLSCAKGKGTVEGAVEVGEKIARDAQKKKIERVVFDRREYKYHGRVKSLAESARKGGLKF